MTDDPIRHRFIRLHVGEQIPADDLTITLTELRPTTATLLIEASRDVPIGEVRPAEGEADRG